MNFGQLNLAISKADVALEFVEDIDSPERLLLNNYYSYIM